MPRLDLTEAQLKELAAWAQEEGHVGRLEKPRAQAVIAVIAELRRLRENESNTRFLSAIEGEV